MAAVTAAVAPVRTPRGGQGRVEVVPEPGVPGGRGARLGPHHDVGPGGQLGEAFAHQLAQPSLDLVSHDGTADRLGHDEAGTGGEFGTPGPYRLDCHRGRSGTEVDDDCSPSGTATTTDHRGEVTTAPQALRGGQHV